MMSGATLIDLSYPVQDTMLVYPNTERPTFSWKGRANSEGYNLTRVSMLVHTGTHADAPLHFTADGLAIDELPLGAFYGETRVFRLRKGMRGKEFGIGDLEPSLDTLERGAIFLVDTGIGPYAETPEYNFGFSWPSVEVIRALISKSVRCYMTDATSVDPVNTKDNISHKTLFGAGIPVVENLANLHTLPTEKKFIVCAFPLRLAGREGSPCRAVAIV